MLRIVVEKGNEYQATAENIYRKDSFFSDVYQMAKECIGEILYVGKNFEDFYDSKKGCSDAELNAGLMGYSNNLIAFCANRGHGKTSTMLSCANALKKIGENIDVDNNYYTKEEFWEGTDARNYHYEVIESIDPTMMENGDSILQVILSRMFSHFQETWEQKYNNRRYGDVLKDLELSRNKLARTFQKCYHSIQVLKNEKKCGEDDELDQIMELGDSSNMRGILYRLVCEYLEFVCGNKKSYLIIQIDDADLNIEKAYSIIEDIRKYLVMPRVIVLMAVNMNQLESTVEQYFISQYQVSITNKGMVDIEQCHEIAERYIDKVIPGRRQIHLPNLSKVLSEGYDSVIVSYKKNFINDGTEYLLDGLEKKEQEAKSGKEYQYQLLQFLRRRTGIVLMNPKTFLHNILPGNMRELAHFLVYFGDIEELHIGYKDLIDVFAGEKRENFEDSLELWKKNLRKFQHYLVDLWSAVNLREEGRSFLKSLSREPLDNKNRHVLKFLPDYYAHEREAVGVVRGVSTLKGMDYRKQFIDECEKRGVCLAEQLDVCEYASYADVYTALSVLGELPGWNRQYKFVYAIRLYYSIQLHQLLLEQIERNMTGKEESDSLVSFIEDILYRRGKENKLPENLPYQRFYLNENDLYKYLESVGSLTQEDYGVIQRFCRYEIKGVRTYQTISTTAVKSCNQDRKLVFNMFYPLLCELDMLSYCPKVVRESYKTDDNARSSMLMAFMILLNADVQYMISRKIKEYEIKAQEQSSWLCEYISEFYKMCGIKDVLLEAFEKNEEQAVTRFIEIYGDKKGYGQFMSAVQLSCPDMSEMTDNYCKKVCEDLKRLNESLKELLPDYAAKSIGELIEKLTDASQDSDDYWNWREKILKMKEYVSQINDIMSANNSLFHMFGQTEILEQVSVFQDEKVTLEKIEETVDSVTDMIENKLNEKRKAK